MITEELTEYGELKRELNTRRKAYNNSVKDLKNRINELEQSITKQILEAGKTVQIENVRAEYKPTVVIKIKREHEND